jgi:cysteine-rich repeat protein
MLIRVLVTVALMLQTAIVGIANAVADETAPTPVPTATPQNSSVLCENIGAPPGALYLYDDGFGPATINGSAFLISGNDLNYSDGQAGSGSAILGIATHTEANAQETRDGLSSGQSNNVQGLGYVPSSTSPPSPATPSISATSSPSTAQIDQFVTALLELPHTRLLGTTLSVNWTFGTTAAPMITYLPGSGAGVTMTAGNFSGAGILIVEDALTITSNFHFVGLIIVRGMTNVLQVTGRATIWGSLWTTEFHLAIGGDADIQYSSEALALAAVAGGNAACESAACGDGIRTYNEACDDGNQISGDGCSSMCIIETTSNPTATPMPPATATVTPALTVTTAPTATPGCGILPEIGCRVPAVAQKATLALRDAADDTRDALSWTWRRGAATTRRDFGDPILSTSYDLCIYDGSMTLIAAASVPAGGLCGTSSPKSCWKRTAKGFRYADNSLAADGVQSVALSEGLASHARMLVDARGVNVEMPLLPVSALPLHVQLKNTAGVCWEATYSAPTRNDVGQFRARAD